MQTVKINKQESQMKKENMFLFVFCYVVIQTDEALTNKSF